MATKQQERKATSQAEPLITGEIRQRFNEHAAALLAERPNTRLFSLLASFLRSLPIHEAERLHARAQHQPPGSALLPVTGLRDLESRRIAELARLPVDLLPAGPVPDASLDRLAEAVSLALLARWAPGSEAEGIMAALEARRRLEQAEAWLAARMADYEATVDRLTPSARAELDRALEFSRTVKERDE